MQYKTDGLNPVKPNIKPLFALVFHGVADSASVITLHKIENNLIGIGDYIAGQAVREIIEEATTDKEVPQSTYLMPTNLLIDDAQKLVWFTKAQRKVLHIRHLKINSHQMVSFPALLFIAHKDQRKVRIFALGSSAKPTINTKLYHAPFFNLDGAGGLCLGDACLPTDIHMQTLTEIESVFFDANGTHTNHNETLSTFAIKQHRSLFGFWKHKAKTQDKVFVKEMNAYKLMSEVLSERI